MSRHENDDERHSTLPLGPQARNRIEREDLSLTPYKYCSMCNYTVTNAHRGSLSEALAKFSEHNQHAHKGRAHLGKDR